MRLSPFQSVALSALAALSLNVASAQCPFSLDTGAAAAIATDDGLVLSRFASGVRGSPALNNATTLSSTAEATTVSRLRRFDVDGNGVFDQTDGQIIQRHLMGFRGTALGDGGAYAVRLTPSLIEAYIAQGCPGRSMTARERASRFLTQATWGPTWSGIDTLAAAGANDAAFDAWITAQFNTPSMDSHWDYIARKGPRNCATIPEGCKAIFINATMETFWQQAAQSPDQLRQRAAFALQQIFVVSTVNSAIDIQPDAHASFLDATATNAFGNFRTLLEVVTRHPTMGHYLSHMRNEKEDPATGRTPDENYAREILQLFSIGLWELELDGTRKKDASGRDIPTYNQNDIIGLAKVFTGLSWGGGSTSEERWRGWLEGSTRWDIPLQMYPQFHSASEKKFLGTTVPALPGTLTQAQADDSLRIALDRIFNHSSTAPFISKQLIKRLVTSNPSPAYVRRVAEKFVNNGSGVRGDMKAVWRAVLMDPEARDEQRLADESFGKLREPLLRLGVWLRAFNATPSSGRFQIWNLEDPIDSLGQNPMRSPSVFNFYRPDYAPPGAILNRTAVAPEFQITHETTATSYANFVVNTVSRGLSDLQPDYARYRANIRNASAMVDDLNVLLAYGQLTPATQKIIVDAVNAIPEGGFQWENGRVYTAIVLTMLAPEFLIQR
ncbi:MAG: DUF1800 domain-containing protein [Betaproteobacteria bacterium]|nr:MAG: DUF1800 domain-containing protein [Betaproteobacteria bacterium]